MALSKKNSRPITVDEVEYRYSVSTSPTAENSFLKINITIQHCSGTGCYLQVEGNISRDFWLDISDEVQETSEYLKITPKYIAKVIKLAIQDGWNPTGKSGPYIFKALGAS